MDEIEKLLDNAERPFYMNAIYKNLSKATKIVVYTPWQVEIDGIMLDLVPEDTKLIKKIFNKVCNKKLSYDFPIIWERK